MSDALDKLANNVGLALTARLAMIATPFAASVFAWLMTGYLDGRFDRVFDRLVVMEAQSSDSAQKVEDVTVRVAALETSTALGRATRDNQYAQVLARLDKLADGQSTAQALIAALAARVDASLQRGPK